MRARPRARSAPRPGRSSSKMPRGTLSTTSTSASNERSTAVIPLLRTLIRSAIGTSSDRGKYRPSTPLPSDDKVAPDMAQALRVVRVEGDPRPAAGLPDRPVRQGSLLETCRLRPGESHVSSDAKPRLAQFNQRLGERTAFGEQRAQVDVPDEC